MARVMGLHSQCGNANGLFRVQFSLRQARSWFPLIKGLIVARIIALPQGIVSVEALEWDWAELPSSDMRLLLALITIFLCFGCSQDGCAERKDRFLEGTRVMETIDNFISQNGRLPKSIEELEMELQYDWSYLPNRTGETDLSGFYLSTFTFCRYRERLEYRSLNNLPPRWYLSDDSGGHEPYK